MGIVLVCIVPDGHSSSIESFSCVIQTSIDLLGEHVLRRVVVHDNTYFTTILQVHPTNVLVTLQAQVIIIILHKDSFLHMSVEFSHCGIPDVL